MFRLLENQMLVPNLHLAVLEAPEVAAAAQPGQFVIVRPGPESERIPLTISDWDARQGTVTVVYLNVGKTTGELAVLAAGENVATVAGPLGNPMELGHFGHVVCVGGCYGIASLYPIVRGLKALGNRVTMVVEARSAYLLFWQKRLKTVSDQLVVITRDGSKGLPGHINNLPGILERLPVPADRVILNGCNYLMMRGAEETRPLGIRTMVTLNTLMIDGTGMCGVCRCTVAGSTKFACVDGPHFDGHEVNWDEVTRRRQAYLREEMQTLRSSRGEMHSQ
ncbi:MAG: sulfide/dihydroorotate dehydrogenase-like FAD/NAD-binding protein [Anaerolineaceae bacterium]|nr:sulfide/dihydroorotate dehydrogenase-like FAD/NAD-binding protein [Anaerolineaceae bacterium]